MNLKEHIQINAGVGIEPLNEGLKFFKLSTKLKKAITRLEKSKDNNPKLVPITSKLKEIEKKVSIIENKYKSKTINKSFAKTEVKKLVKDTVSLSREAKSSLGIKIMKKTGLVIAISAILAVAVGIAGITGFNIAIDDKIDDAFKDFTPKEEEYANKVKRTVGDAMGPVADLKYNIENKLVSVSRKLEDLVIEPNFEKKVERWVEDLERRAEKFTTEHIGRRLKR